MAAWDIFGAAVGLVYLSLRSSFGRLLQTPSIFRDMSQARVDEAIAAEHEALNEAQAIGQMGSWRRELASGEWRTSAEFRRIVELDVDEDPAEHLMAVYSDDLSRVLDAIDQAGGGSHGEATYRLRCNDGSERHLHLRARPDPDASGQIVAVAGTVQDRTQQASMEAAVREARKGSSAPPSR